MARQIITYPDPILRQEARPVDVINGTVSELAQDMARLMYEKRGIGLAAPQVGESLRVITVDVTGPDIREGLRTFINPEIVWSQGETDFEEGCLSVINFQAKVQRAERLRIRALDLEGREVEEEGEGLWAICVQHEIDHLNGILFIDHLSRLKRSMYEKRLRKWLEEKKE